MSLWALCLCMYKRQEIFGFILVKAMEENGENHN